MSDTSFEVPGQDRYSRHRLIEWWDQDKLLTSKVLVAGAGALGNEVIKNLALLGIGHICIIDFDQIEISNLTRSVLFRDSDLGRWKAEVAAERAKQINPDIEVLYITGDLEIDLGLGLLKQFDIAIGCLDSVNARWALNKICRKASVPWINGGLGSSAVEVSFFTPDHPCCYECTMTDDMWVRLNNRYSCTKLLKAMPPRSFPTTVAVSAIAGAIQVQQAVAYLHGHNGQDTLLPGQKLYLSIKPYNLFVVDLPSNIDCIAHDPIPKTVTIRGNPRTLTASEVISTLRDNNLEIHSLHLDYDFVVALECNLCGLQPFISPLKKISSVEGICPICQSMRVPVIANEIKSTDHYASEPLSRFGIPNQAVIGCETQEGCIFIELQD